MYKYIVTLLCAFLVACGSTGKIQQGNENAVTILDRAGGFGDQGAALAAEHCAKYGKVAVFESATGPNPARLNSYLCH